MITVSMNNQFVSEIFPYHNNNWETQNSKAVQLSCLSFKDREKLLFLLHQLNFIKSFYNIFLPQYI